MRHKWDTKINIHSGSVLGWRRSHRPSLRDISIDEEDEDCDKSDPELGQDVNTLQNTLQNAHSIKDLTQIPAFTVTK